MSISLAILAVVAELTVSSKLLAQAGFSYASEGGVLFEKLHPGFYLAACAVAVRMCDQGRPLRFIKGFVFHDWDMALFMGAMVFCIAFSAAMAGLENAAPLLDTFFAAGMIGIVLSGIQRMAAARLAGILRVLFLVNAVIAIMEALLRAHFVPPGDDLSLRSVDFRSFALYDHPLTGAASSMIGLFLMPDRSRQPRWAILYIVLLMTAILTFGGRTAVTVTLAIAIMLFLRSANRTILHQKVSVGRILLTIFVACLSVVLAGAIVATGLAERLLEHFYWDPSAQVRVDEFRILTKLTVSQMTLGCPRSDLLAMVEGMRLDYGVEKLENFWLIMAATLGLPCFFVFLLGLFGLVHFLSRRSDLRGRLMIAAMFLTASASNSLGRKSTLLVILVASVMAAVPERRPHRPMTMPQQRGWVIG